MYNTDLEKSAAEVKILLEKYGKTIKSVRIVENLPFIKRGIEIIVKGFSNRPFI